MTDGYDHILNTRSEMSELALGIRPGYSSYAQLLAMLEQGWRIEPPVYVRAQWRSRARQEDAYHLIVWLGNRVNVVSLADSPEIRQFLQEQGMAVDRL